MKQVLSIAQKPLHSEPRKHNMIPRLMAGPIVGLMLMLASLIPISLAQAEEIMIGDLMLHDPWISATIGNKPVTGGYVMIHNHGDHDDRLIGIAAAFAGKVEIHEMSMVNDVMRMRPLADGLPLPAGEKVMLEPGGYHFMFMKLNQPIAADTMYPVTLIFEKAGEIEIAIMAKDIKDMDKHSH